VDVSAFHSADIEELVGVSSFNYLGYYDGLGQVRGAQVGAGWAQAFGVSPWAQRQKIAALAE
jgi:hypothetical protein